MCERKSGASSTAPCCIEDERSEAAIASLAADVVAFEMMPPLALPPGGARDAEGFAAWLEGFEEIDVEARDLDIEAEGALDSRAR